MMFRDDEEDLDREDAEDQFMKNYSSNGMNIHEKCDADDLEIDDLILPKASLEIVKRLEERSEVDNNFYDFSFWKVGLNE